MPLTVEASSLSVNDVHWFIKLEKLLNRQKNYRTDGYFSNQQASKYYCAAFLACSDHSSGDEVNVGDRILRNCVNGRCLRRAIRRRISDDGVDVAIAL